MVRVENAPPKARMRLSGLIFFYRQRLGEQTVPELFAGLGIAVAVALVFAVTVASQSIIDSADEVNRALVGPASLQLRARSQEGIEEHILDRVETLGESRTQRRCSNRTRRSSRQMAAASLSTSQAPTLAWLFLTGSCTRCRSRPSKRGG